MVLGQAPRRWIVIRTLRSCSLLAEQIVDIPVPRGRGSSGVGGLQGFQPRQGSHRTVEQNVDNPVPSGGLPNFRSGQCSTASSAVQPGSRQVGTGVVADSSSSTPAAHHDGAVPRDDLRVHILTEGDRPFFWHRQDRTSHWVMPPGTRQGWVRTLDGLLVHIETKNLLRSIAGMN